MARMRCPLRMATAFAGRAPPRQILIAFASPRSRFPIDQLTSMKTHGMNKFLSTALTLLVSFSIAHSQDNLLSDPSLDESEPNTTENPFWTLEVVQPNENGRAAQFQNSGWASFPNGTPGFGLWFRAFEGSDEDDMSGAQATLTQRVSGTAGLTYELSAWHKVEANYISASTVLAIDFLDENGDTLTSEALELNGQHPADGSWVQYRVKSKAPDNTTEVQARAQMVDGVNAMANPQSAMLDDFFLQTIDEQTASFVTGSQLLEGQFSVMVEQVEGSVLDVGTALLAIDGTPVTVTPSTAGAITSFTHTPTTPWEAGARLPWTFSIMDVQGTEITAEGILRIPGSLIYGGGEVSTVQVLSSETTTNAEEARTALSNPDDGDGTITVNTPYIHFEDGAGPPILESLSRPYPLFDADLGGDPELGGADNFAIVSTGNFYLREGGTIPFVVNSDDGFQLRINGELVGEFGNRSRNLSSFITVDLDEGEHAFELLQWEAAGAAGVSVYIGRLTVLDGAQPPSLSEEFYELLTGYDVHEVVTEDRDGDGMDDFKERFFFGNLGSDGTGDQDGDGLADSAELAARADPTQVDTDGDGINDGAEVTRHGSSPALIDTDGDGLTDPQEINEFGTDPALADTDTDGFADNIELALESDPLDSGNFPDVIVATSNGPWNAPGSWMDGMAPQAGSDYFALGGVTSRIESAAGAFAGDSLTPRRPGPDPHSFPFGRSQCSPHLA